MTRLPEEPDRLFLWPEPERWVGRRIATSHQPELFHAGIWVREFVLAELALQGWEATYFEADGAESTVQAVIPTPGPLRVERVGLAQGQLERLPAPSERSWGDFLQGLRARLPRGIELYQDWLEEANLARFLARLRHRAAPHELPRSWQSDWMQSQISRRLIEPILEDASRFRELFNQICREQRARHGWRSRSHPFPELGQQAGRVELPLWWQRQSIWLDLSGRTLYAGSRPVDPQDPELRPRAALWSAFCRLSSDLYLHGTGGAAYDEATDQILRRFYGLEPPPYAVVWLNLWLDLPAEVQAPARLAELTARVWQVRHNPQRFLPEHPLSLEKERLLQELARARRGQKAGLTSELQQLNQSLARELEPLRSGLENQRAEAHLAVRELAAARYRGYSWLVVPARRLKAISSQRFSSLPAPTGRPERHPGQ